MEVGGGVPAGVVLRVHGGRRTGHCAEGCGAEWEARMKWGGEDGEIWMCAGGEMGLSGFEGVRSVGEGVVGAGWMLLVFSRVSGRWEVLDRSGFRALAGWFQGGGVCFLVQKNHRSSWVVESAQSGIVKPRGYIPAPSTAHLLLITTLPPLPQLPSSPASCLLLRLITHGSFSSHHRLPCPSSGPPSATKSSSLPSSPLTLTSNPSVLPPPSLSSPVIFF